MEPLDKAGAEEYVKGLLDRFSLKFKAIAQPMHVSP